jgi:signal transduction histidine kinase
MASFEERLEQEKLEALKELAYGAGHEINNPLANIAARAQTLLEDERDPERRRKLVAIHRQAMRAHEMIADLMLFARPPQMNIAEFDLGRVVRAVLDETREFGAERGIELTFEAGEGPVVISGDETQLGVAVGAVVKNAIEAVGAGGHVGIAVRRSTAGDETWAEIIVRDDGPGISAEVRRHLFDPFFSGREAGRGLGFGLSKCWRIVTQHGGSVVVNSVGGAGAEFTISLPLNSAPCGPPS